MVFTSPATRAFARAVLSASRSIAPSSSCRSFSDNRSPAPGRGRSSGRNFSPRQGGRRVGVGHPPGDQVERLQRIETDPGHKDPEAVTRFITRARAAAASV